MRIRSKKNTINDLGRLFRTLKYLRPSQFYYRLRKLAYTPLSSLIASKISKRVAEQSFNIKPLINPVRQKHFNNSYLGDRKFVFLNKERTLCKDWLAKEETPLWQFNLYYFDFLFSERGGQEGLMLIEDWIAQIPIGDRLAWHPYPLSRRVCNWIWFLSSNFELAELSKLNHIIHSLKVQIEHLKYFIERDLLGNHLIANAQALIIGGVFFSDQKIIDTGIEILNQQIPEQILADGGHYERSPMYHCIVLEDLATSLSALSSNGYSKPRIVSEAVGRMGDFLRKIIENGSFPLLNDSAYGISATPSNLLDFISAEERTQALYNSDFLKVKNDIGFEYLDSSGLVIVRENQISLTFDVGKIGPDFLPGHAHNDTLSILLGLGGEQILVDSGVFEYQGELRNYFRSARAHNVVMLKDCEPNEIWSSFRVGRRGYPVNVSIDKKARIAWASDNSYRHLNILITRGIQVLESGVIWIDLIEGANSQSSFECNLHFAPGCHISDSLSNADYKSRIISKDGANVATLAFSESVSFRELNSPYSEYFGEKTDRLNLRDVFKYQPDLPRNYGIFKGQLPSNLNQLWENLAQSRGKL